MKPSFKLLKLFGQNAGVKMEKEECFFGKKKKTIGRYKVLFTDEQKNKIVLLLLLLLFFLVVVAVIKVLLYFIFKKLQKKEVV